MAPCCFQGAYLIVDGLEWLRMFLGCLAWTEEGRHVGIEAGRSIEAGSESVGTRGCEAIGGQNAASDRRARRASREESTESAGTRSGMGREATGGERNLETEATQRGWEETPRFPEREKPTADRLATLPEHPEEPAAR